MEDLGKMEVIITNDKIDTIINKEGSGVLGSYNRKSKELTISTSEIWKSTNDEDKFVEMFYMSYNHEVLHHVVSEEIEKQEIELFLRQTYEEIVVKEMNNEKITYQALLSYVVNDAFSKVFVMSMETQSKRMRNFYLKITLIYLFSVTIIFLTNYS